MKKRVICILLAWMLLFMTCLSAMAETLVTTTRFVSVAVSNEVYADVAFDTEWFSVPSSTYNHGLARASLGLATAAFRAKGTDYAAADRNLRSFLAELGFRTSNYRADDFAREPDWETIATGINMQRLNDEQGEYVLLAVGISGQGYGNEWASNFTLSDSTNHAGFEDAAQKVYHRVLNYIDSRAPSERIKVWVSGFSRAAAVSNLVGGLLLQDESFEPDNIFIYTFGCPNTTRDAVAYPQIYNICGAFDPVPKVPLQDWGYKKHGITLYLPSRETVLDYDKLADKAREAYHSINNLTDEFDSTPNRNWLIRKVLQLFKRYLPDAGTYANGVQDVVVAAWLTKGDIMTKLNTALSMLEPEEDDTNYDAVYRIVTELLAVISRGAYDSIGELTGAQQDTSWINLLSSGSEIAHEHYPEVYMAWMNAIDDPEVLFSGGDKYIRLVYTGNMDLLLYQVDMDDAATEENAIMPAETLQPVVDTENGIAKLAVSKLGNEVTICLPYEQGKLYVAQMTARDQTRCQIASSVCDMQLLSEEMNTTTDVNVYKDEYFIVSIRPENNDATMVVSMNSGELLSTENREQLVSAGLSENKNIGDMLSGIVVMIPYAVNSVMILLYLLVVGVKRLIRHKVEDRTAGRTPGKVILGIAVVLCMASCVRCVLQAATYLGRFSAVDVTNHSVQRISEIIGWGMEAYVFSNFMMHVMMAVLCIRSMWHELSRIRLVRLSVIMLLMNTIELVASQANGLLRGWDCLIQITPVLAMFGVHHVRLKSDMDRFDGRRWHKVIAATVLTLLLFLVREVLLVLLPQDEWICMVLKNLTGIPSLLLAMHIAGQSGKRMQKTIVLGMLLCVVGDTLINVNMLWGIIFFGGAHIMFILAFMIEKSPRWYQYVLWAIFSGALIVYTLTMQTVLPGALLPAACIYAVLGVGTVITSAPVNKRILVAASIFAISDALIPLRLLVPGTIVLDVAGLMAYYIAMLMLAVDPEYLAIEYLPKKNHEQEA